MSRAGSPSPDRDAVSTPLDNGDVTIVSAHQPISCGAAVADPTVVFVATVLPGEPSYGGSK
jgi:hypothetical protein